ncbi:MAG: hypothetical protein JSS63_10440 [Bacteroidetes bacterium]|nr:hypothetical protein [Bacteroidota bacterium]
MDFTIDDFSRKKDVDWLYSKIKSKDKNTNTPEFAFLLGAGCSVSSGIPTGGKVIEYCQKISFYKKKLNMYDVS